MKWLTGLLSLCLLVSSAQAAAVLIDFDEVTPQGGVPPLFIDSKGFSFEATTVLAGGPPEVGVSSAGIFAMADCFAWGGGCGAVVFMEVTGGSQFAIHSIGSWQGSFSGVVAGGGVADLSAPIGTGDWLQLERFSVGDFCPELPGFGCGYYTASLDDISASVVPIPAAAWLFVSALMGLGWLRRNPA